jgi:hypothetical protein
METPHTDSQAFPPQTGSVAHAAPARAGRFFTMSVAVWALLAGLATAYLAMVVLKPGTIAAYLPSLAPAGSPEDNEGQRANVLASKEAQELRDSVGQLQLEVAKIKTDMSAKSDHDKALETRLTVLEDAKHGVATAAPATASTAKAPVANAAASATSGIPVTTLAPAVPVSPTVAAPATVAAKAAAKKAAAAAAAKVAPAAAAAAPSLAPAANAAAAIAPPLANPEAVASPANGVKLINSPLSASSAASKAAPAAPVVAPAPEAKAVAPANAAETLAPSLETGSVQNLGASGLEPPAPVAKVAKPVGIYIGSGPSVDSLRSSWGLISERNADSLANLQPRYTTGIDSNGLNYGLVAGPVSSTAEAQKLCKDLAAKAVTCRVGDFGGEPL